MKLNRIRTWGYFLGLGVALFFTGVLNVSANEGFMGKKEGWDEKKWEERAAAMNKQLGLSPEQETQLKAHREKHRGEMKELYQKIKAKREDLQAALQKEDFNAGQVKQIHAELKTLKSEAEDDRLEGILEVRKVLTPEQFNKFTELKKNRKDHKDGEESSQHGPEDKN